MECIYCNQNRILHVLWAGFFAILEKSGWEKKTLSQSENGFDLASGCYAWGIDAHPVCG